MKWKLEQNSKSKWKKKKLLKKWMNEKRNYFFWQYLLILSLFSMIDILSSEMPINHNTKKIKSITLVWIWIMAIIIINLEFCRKFFRWICPCWSVYKTFFAFYHFSEFRIRSTFCILAICQIVVYSIMKEIRLHIAYWVMRQIYK